ncbi:MAG: lysophospholipid acyltransferase family protein [Planctomycetota bacterium]|nr:lysophospholipid acyltransferase family protein [Planctomycetota bacterium]
MSTKAPARRGALGSGRPERRPRDLQLDRAAYACARLALLLFRALPGGAARALGRALGRLAWRVSRRYRNQVLRHMEIAFRDEASREQKETWCRRYFEHTGLSLVEFARMDLLTRENVEATVDLADASILQELLARPGGKGVLLVPAHHGNWELGGYAGAILGLPFNSVARPLDNPLLHRMVWDMRERSGNRLIEKWNVLWHLKKLLDTGHLVLMSIDQNGGVAGVFVPMFGTLASTVASPADLQAASKAPIAVCTTNRQADGIRHVFKVWDVIEHVPGEDPEAARLRILTRINRAYEQAVRAYPEQWLWVHRRWKTRPPGEQPGPDGLPPRVQTGA